MYLDTRFISANEKIFSTDMPSGFNRCESMSALLGERIAVQLAYRLDPDGQVTADVLTPRLSGELAPYSSIRRVGYVPVVKTSAMREDDNYLGRGAGIYPDPLLEMHYGGKVRTEFSVTDTLWIDIELPSSAEEISSLSTLTVELLSEKQGGAVSSDTLSVDLIPVRLPEQKLCYAQWFYPDCLASYYSVDMWSQRHWEIIESFMRESVRCGTHAVLLPLLTPSTDGVRPICQLVSITKEDGKYSFDFSRLEKWLSVCDRVGVKIYEVAHFFSAGGGIYTTRVSAKVDGEERIIFDCDPAEDPEYRALLRALLTEFIDYMKKEGRDQRCIFHISDEPTLENKEHYRIAKECIADLIAGYKQIDALSDVDYFTEGLVACPVPITNKFDDFLDFDIPERWCYYCMGPGSMNYSNRFIAMPSYRTRSIGMQMFKYDVKGFLHWGYNFYYNCESDSTVNPFIELSGECWSPAGDAFIVYPGLDGKPIGSLREEVFYHALEDMRAMELCAEMYSRELVISAIEEELGCEITLRSSARSADVMTRVRERINAMIKAKSV